MSNIKKYYVSSFFSSMMFFSPILMLYYTYYDISYTQIFVLQSIYTITTLFLEVPSGYLGDKFGTKKIIIIGNVLMMFGFLSYFMATSLILMIVAEVLLGSSRAMFSGSGETFLYLSQDNKNDRDNTRLIFINVKTISMIAMTISSILGGVVGEYFGYNIPFILCFSSLFICFIISLTYKIPKHENIEEKKAITYKMFMKDIIDSLKYLWNIKPILYLMINSAILLSIITVATWFVQPFLKESGVLVLYFGAVYASINIISAILTKLLSKVEKKYKPNNVLMIIDLMFVVTLFTTFISNTPFFAILLVIIIFSLRILRVQLYNVYLNLSIRDYDRVTIISIGSLIRAFIYIIISITVGYVSDWLTFKFIFPVLGVVYLFVVVFYNIAIIKNKIELDFNES